MANRVMPPLPHEIRVYGNTGTGRCVLVREGEDDVDLTSLLAIKRVTADVKVAHVPTVTLTVVARLVHNP